VLAHLAALSAAVDIPVNADFEGGFADAPEGVAANVTRAVATGLAGLSIEDSTGNKADPLYERGMAVARIRAARQAIDAAGGGVMLTGRCEAFLWGKPDLDLAIDRLKAYSEAGADCLYAPGIKTAAEISAVVKAVAPKPVNLLASPALGAITVAEIGALGVKRISVGGLLARAAYSAALRAAREMATSGTFAFAKEAVPFAELDGMFR
jgi:2-methylisocitrate lyase-like PEP mutase family enzyme